MVEFQSVLVGLFSENKFFWQIELDRDTSNQVRQHWKVVAVHLNVRVPESVSFRTCHFIERSRGRFVDVRNVADLR